MVRISFPIQSKIKGPKPPRALLGCNFNSHKVVWSSGRLVCRLLLGEVVKTLEGDNLSFRATAARASAAASVLANLCELQRDKLPAREPMAGEETEEAMVKRA